MSLNGEIRKCYVTDIMNLLILTDPVPLQFVLQLSKNY